MLFLSGFCIVVKCAMPESAMPRILCLLWKLLNTVEDGDDNDIAMLLAE